MDIYRTIPWLVCTCGAMKLALRVCVCVQVTWVGAVTRVGRVRRVRWVNQVREVTAAAQVTAATLVPPDARAASVHQAHWAHPASRDPADTQDRPGMPDNWDRLDCRVRLGAAAALERRECRDRVVRWVSQGSRATLGSQELAEYQAVGVEQAPLVLVDSLETAVLQGNEVPSALAVRASVDCSVCCTHSMLNTRTVQHGYTDMQ